MKVRDDYLAFGKPNFSDTEIAAVTAVMRSGWIGMGAQTIAFEEELAAHLGAPQVVAASSCTAALFLSLAALGVGPGDEVVCPSLTWCSTANAALYLGARPILCDVDADSYCTTPELVLAKLTPRTRAVIVVHMGGLAVDIAAFRKALPADVAIVEDAAHALGARYPDGTMVGAAGSLACFSFYANKNLSTGEGGAVSLGDRALADRLKSLRLHALPVDAWKRYSNPKSLLLSGKLTELGYKMNFTDLQASIGRVQLQRQGEFQRRRLEIARCYAEELHGLELRMQSGVLDERHARHLFLIELPVHAMRRTRDDVLLELRARNIGASIHYAPLHTMPLYQSTEPLPNAERIFEGIVTLPI